MNEILAKSKCIDEQRLYQMRGGGIDVHNANSILREVQFWCKAFTFYCHDNENSYSMKSSVLYRAYFLFVSVCNIRESHASCMQHNFMSMELYLNHLCITFCKSNRKMCSFTFMVSMWNRWWKAHFNQYEH